MLVCYKIRDPASSVDRKRRIISSFSTRFSDVTNRKWKREGTANTCTALTHNLIIGPIDIITQHASAPHIVEQLFQSSISKQAEVIYASHSLIY